MKVRNFNVRDFALVAVTLLSLGLGSILVAGLPGRTEAVGSEQISMAECESRNLTLLKLEQSPSVQLLQDLVGLCYSEYRSQGLLSNFGVIQKIYFQQYYANGVLLWMVVAITISGVILAAIQLVASYKLAALNRLPTVMTTDEITLKKDQLVLKSSVTGLFILLISFAFFLVFVLYVYKVDDPNKDRGDSSKGDALKGLTPLPLGGLGSPPAAAPPVKSN